VTDNNQSKGEDLCTSCGMCCEGVFHTHAMIYSKKDILIATRIEATILEDPVEGQDSSFSLPCPAFKGKCSVYPTRPSVCKEHRCELLKTLIADDISLDHALDHVEALREAHARILPELQALSGNSLSNRPETLMNEILEALPAGQARTEFKRNHSELLIQLGVYKFMRESTFYPQESPMDSK
jgi:Fe-S-cluster containining protein